MHNLKPKSNRCNFSVALLACWTIKKPAREDPPLDSLQLKRAPSMQRYTTSTVYIYNIPSSPQVITAKPCWSCLFPHQLVDGVPPALEPLRKKTNTNKHESKKESNALVSANRSFRFQAFASQPSPGVDGRTGGPAPPQDTTRSKGRAFTCYVLSNAVSCV